MPGDGQSLRLTGDGQCTNRRRATRRLERLDRYLEAGRSRTKTPVARCLLPVARPLLAVEDCPSPVAGSFPIRSIAGQPLAPRTLWIRAARSWRLVAFSAEWDSSARRYKRRR